MKTLLDDFEVHDVRALVVEAPEPAEDETRPAESVTPAPSFLRVWSSEEYA